MVSIIRTLIFSLKGEETKSEEREKDEILY